jgi:hypothetical protein
MILQGTPEGTEILPPFIIITLLNLITAIILLKNVSEKRAMQQKA